MNNPKPANDQALKPQKRAVERVKPCTKELGSCPEDVQDAILFQLNERVAWGKSPTQNVDPKKVRDDVMQMSFPYKGNTFRALYSTKKERVVLLLVVFQKKTNGPANDQYDLAEDRLERWSA